MGRGQFFPGQERHGKVNDKMYIAMRKDWGPEEFVTRSLPHHKEGWTKPASMIQQNSVLTEINRELQTVKADPVRMAAYDEAFAALCAREGETYEKNGVVKKRRKIDFIRQQLMKERFNAKKNG